MPPTDSPKILTVIPARYASTRFPGKMVAQVAGKPVVLHTYERACQAKLVSEAVIALDDDRIAQALDPFGVPYIMTRVDHPSGTDRIAEVAEKTDADIIVNVQGDEPLIDPNTIDRCIQPLLDDPDLPMSTAMCPITDPELIANPNAVKVVCDTRGRALYFSRCPVPFIRDDKNRGDQCYYLHLGLYVYRRDFLIEYAKWPVTPLEQLESLEQLRALENGYPIAVVKTTYDGVGVDSPEDLELVRAELEAD